MNTESYKRKLLAEEQRLMSGLSHAEANAKEVGDQATGDATDETVQEGLKEEQFRQAETDWSLLRQVREALQRIEEGTYGQCVVDGGPIEEKRLNAMPWTSYCMKHQKLLETSNPPSTPTL